MDDVFRHYNVCEDVCDIIAKKLHQGYQKEINEHISVIVGWDPRFDYWTFGNYKPKHMFWPYAEPAAIGGTPRTLLQELCKLYNNKFKTKTTKITKEDYLMYVLSTKKVFKMCRPVRWNRFIDALDNRYIWPEEEPKLSGYFIRTTKLQNSKYRDLEFELMHTKLFKMGTCYNPVLSFIFKQNLTRKDLINWLNKNGDPRKLTNKTKKELWDIILKMK